MTYSALFVISTAALSAIFGCYVGRSRARRTRDLWQGIKQGKPESLAVVAVVAIIVLYVLLSYTPLEH